MKKIIPVGFFMLVILTSLVSAGGVGISPAYYKEFFSPGLVSSFRFHSFNLDPTKGVNIFIRGDLAKYANLSELNLTGGGELTVTIRLPNKIDIPGTHKLYVGVIESKKINGSNASAVGGIASVQGRIDIFVPYPGRYSESTFSINNINEGEESGYELNIQNLGVQDLSVKSKIDIYKDNLTKKLITKNMKEFTLNTKHSITSVGTIDTRNLPAGKYQAVATVDWGKITKMIKTFRIGEFLVEISDYDYLFEQGKINKFNIEIKNKWNTKINKVFADVVITDNGKVVRSFKTVSVSANPWEVENITGYFDATGLKPKRYIASIVLYYDGQTSSKLVAIYVRKPAPQTYIKYIIIAVISILLITLMFIYLILKIRKLKRNGKKK